MVYMVIKGLGGDIGTPGLGGGIVTQEDNASIQC